MISFRAGPTATTAKLDGTCVNPLHPDLQVLADATLVLKCKEGGRRGGGGAALHFILGRCHVS